MRALVGAGGVERRTRRHVVFVVAVLVALAAVPLVAGMGRSEPVVATWYGPGFEGAITASGEPFNASDYTAASRTLPFGTKLIVTYEGRSVVVRVNDRGPYSSADLDLSQAAAEYLGMTAVGIATVDVVQADPSTPTGPYAAPTDSASAGGAADGGADGSEDQYEEPVATGQYEPVDESETEDTSVVQPTDGEPEADLLADGGVGATIEGNSEDEQYDVVDALASVGEDQYADEDVEESVGEAGAEAPKVEAQESEAPAPAPPAPVAAAAPVVQEVVIPPPPEVVVPGSTTERRLALAGQPAPEGSPSAEAKTLPAAPAAEPEAPEQEPVVEKTSVEEPVVIEEPVVVETTVEEPVAEEPEENPQEPAGVVEGESDSGSGELPSDTLTVLPDTGGPAVAALAG
jgi:rare lipoprotein A